MKADGDFITEFRALYATSPKCGSWTRASENCDYGDITTVSKDCYMCFNSGNCRNAYYCDDSRAMKDCTDCAFCEGCELSYECTDCESLYNSDFCQDCTNCDNVHFCYDCRRCKDCIGCVCLRDKQYCIFNEQLSEKEYNEKVKKLNLEDKSGLAYIAKTVEELKRQTPRMFTHTHDTQNCTGDYIYHSKNCHMCFDTRHTEDSGYIIQANLDMGTRDSYDCGPVPTGMDICYDIAYSHYLFNCKHLYWCGNMKDSQYCTSCFESENMFGCHYMQKKQKGFWILNEEVEEDYYRKKVPEIVAGLRERGIYNLWDLVNKEKLERMEIGDDERKRKCVLCGEGFEIIDKEVEFYKKMDVVLPVYCPGCRAQQRISLRGKRKMHKSKCDSCQNTLITTYPPDTKDIVYCLDCYWKNIG